MAWYVIYRESDSESVSWGTDMPSPMRPGHSAFTVPRGQGPNEVMWDKAALSVLAKPRVIEAGAALKAKASSTWTTTDLADALKLLI